MVPPEKVHTKLFVGSQTKFKKPKHPATTRYNQERTADQIEKMTKRLVRKELKLRKRLAAHGIDYEFPGFVSLFGLVNDQCCTACFYSVSCLLLQAAQVPPKKKSSGAMDASTCSDVSVV